MSNVRARKDGRLFFDFYYRGVRCRELTSLPDTPDNRRKMERALRVIDVEIANGTFDYARTFPGGRRAVHVAKARPVAEPPALKHAPAMESDQTVADLRGIHPCLEGGEGDRVAALLS